MRVSCRFDRLTKIIGSTREIVQVLDDPLDPVLIEHSFLDLVRMRIFGILAGSEDQNDHETLRTDPVFKLVNERLPTDNDLASQPLCRDFENQINILSLFRLRALFVEPFIPCVFLSLTTEETWK